MLFKKTRDLIIETATIVKGLSTSFDKHIDDNKNDIDGLYKVIKDCHESCPESERFDEYIKGANGTLLRIEKKYDQYYRSNKDSKQEWKERQDDYLKKLETVKTEVQGIKEKRKTIREVLGDIGKVIGYIVLVCGLLFGILRYMDTGKKKGEVQIEKLLKELIKVQGNG